MLLTDLISSYHLSDHHENHRTTTWVKDTQIPAAAGIQRLVSRSEENKTAHPNLYYTTEYTEHEAHLSFKHTQALASF